MTGNKSSADQMLERAYSVSTDEEVRALYREWAEDFDETLVDKLGYLTPSKTARLLSRKMANTAARILDVGSGTGLAGEELAKLGFTNIDALDYSPEMLAVARQRTVNGNTVYKQVIEADLNLDLDMKDGTYDGLICTGTFTHAHVGANCLEELFRILKPGGHFACTVHEEVWDNAGFAEKVDRLTGSGTLRTISMEKDTYFNNNDNDKGWFLVWEKLA